MNSNFKPNLIQYGSIKRYRISLKALFVGFCVITPFTNFLIPVGLKYINGSLELRV